MSGAIIPTYQTPYLSEWTKGTLATEKMTWFNST